VIYNIWGKLAGNLIVKDEAEQEAELTETGVSFWKIFSSDTSDLEWRAPICIDVQASVGIFDLGESTSEGAWVLINNYENILKRKEENFSLILSYLT